MHLPGVKKIKHLTYSPKVSIMAKTFLKLEQMSYSYVCYFNKQGKLMHVINLRTDFKYTFTYDFQGRLNRIIEIDKYTNRLTMENLINHINDKNFEEKLIIYRYGTIPVKENNIHLLEDNTYKVLMNVNNKNEFHTYTTVSYPKENTEEEFLESKNSILYWEVKQFNSNEQEISHYEADKNGYFDPKDSYTTTYFENGLVKTYSYNGKSGFTKKHEYDYDEKGNWISQTLFLDDIPQYIYERELEYY